MSMPVSPEEVLETNRMIQSQNLDIRAVTLGLDLRDCLLGSPDEALGKIKSRIMKMAGQLVNRAKGLETKYGLPIVNKRIAVTPAAWLVAGRKPGYVLDLARTLDQAAGEAGIDFIGGFGALVEKGFSEADRRVLEALPEVMAATERLCAFANLGTTRAGLNLDGVALMGRKIKEIAAATPAAIGCAKLVCFANAPHDNPFMAGAFHGAGEGAWALNVGVSGPGVVRAAVEENPDCDLGALADLIKRAAFKVTRTGEMIGRELAGLLGVDFGIVDLSLAPTPTVGDSVAEIMEAMGLDMVGGPGSTMAVAMLVDAVKKGGVMASGHVGGLSGTFLPVSEDGRMAAAAEAGALTIEKLEAMTAVCSVGLDMVVIPGDVPAETLAALIADELTIG